MRSLPGLQMESMSLFPGLPIEVYEVVVRVTNGVQTYDCMSVIPSLTMQYMQLVVSFTSGIHV